ncbi:MAG: non-hydrolyzing UDP-N-acetylglucosamine 2-epimerase [Waddliaceae bacterium]
MKVTIITGNRPQFIKAAALYRAINQWNNEQSKKMHAQLVHTGQHYDENMSDVFFSEMDLPKPNYFLGVGGCPQGAMTGRMLEKIETLLNKERPSWVLVFGDTNSTLAGALAATKMHIPVAHVEAGLRSFNREMPEEINRILTDQCADLLFTPAEQASRQLLSEGILEQKIFQVGDVMLDAFLHYQKKAEQKSTILEQLGLNSTDYVLVTIHRAANTDNSDRLKEIIMGLRTIGGTTRVVFSLHPRTKKALEKQQLLASAKEDLMFIEPVGFFDMIQLESHAQMILTDSGGVQKEAYYCKVPCLILRDETEWTELLEYGFNRLVTAKKESIITSFQECRKAHPNWGQELYGTGTSSKQIVEILMRPIES